MFEPLVADWQREWLESPPQKRAWIRVRGAVALAVAFAIAAPRLATTPVSRETVDGVLTWMFRFSVVMAALLSIPVVGAKGPLWIKSARVLMSLPTVLSLAIPFSIVGAVDVIRRRHSAALPHLQRAAAVKTAAVSAIVMLLIVGRVIPGANQAWNYWFTRATVQAPGRDVRELALTELLRDPARSSPHAVGSAEAERASRISRDINNRLSLVALPVVLMWRRWRATGLPQGRWFSARHPAIATLVVCAAYLSVRFVGRLGTAA